VHGRSRCVPGHHTLQLAVLRSSPGCSCTVRRRRRDLDSLDDLHFGVHEEMMYALNTPPLAGAQWTGIVTQIAISMLESGKVEAVVCVQSDEHDRFSPKPARPVRPASPHALPLVGAGRQVSLVCLPCSLHFSSSKVRLLQSAVQ